MKETNLTKKEIKQIRDVLRERLENYNGTEHIQLDIEPKTLKQIIFEEKINSLIYLESLINGFSRESAKQEATYYTFAIELNLLKKLDLTGIDFFKVDVRGENFTGSKGVSLSPQFVYLQDFSYTTLTDVTILATFHDCKIVGTNFKGSKGAIIEPQTIYSRNLANAILIDTEIKGNLDDCNIEGTIFDKNININDLYQKKSKQILSNINKAFEEPKKKIKTNNQTNQFNK